MSGPSRILGRAAVAMIPDGVIVSGLVLALQGDAISGENRRTGGGSCSAWWFK